MKNIPPNRFDHNTKPPNRRQNSITFILLSAFIITSIIWFYQSYNSDTDNIKEVPISRIITEYNNNNATLIESDGNTVTLTLKSGDKIKSYKSSSDSLSDLGLYAKTDEVDVEVKDNTSTIFWGEILSSIIPFIIIIGFLFFMMKQIAKSSSSAFSFGKSKAKIFSKNKNMTKFSDVAGLDESKEELVEIVDFLKNPNKYTKIGAKIPRGVLIIGPPGTGKTLLARAVAGEANAPFFSISGSEFVEMFVGVGASRVRDLFQKAKRNSPSIIFIDEIDAVGRQRGGTGFGGGHDEREQTLNQILTEMDGFDNKTNVIVIAATNRPDVLDVALLRPGRFDRRITVDLPDMLARTKILEVHSRNKKISKRVDFNKISKQTPGFSGADLENVMNESAIIAAKKNSKEIKQVDIEKSVEKIAMGPEKRSKALNQKEKEITAYHEVGHALVAHIIPECDPVHKVSIISRGMALGVTWFLPEEDKHLYNETKFKSDMASLMGGRVAEEIIFGEVSTGASNDLERASKIARKMVTEYGMSKKIGPVVFGKKYGGAHLGVDLGTKNNYSEEYSKIIDDEVSALVIEAYKKAYDILTKHKSKLEEITKELLKKETLNDEEFSSFFRPIRKKKTLKK